MYFFQQNYQINLALYFYILFDYFINLTFILCSVNPIKVTCVS